MKGGVNRKGENDDNQIHLNKVCIDFSVHFINFKSVYYENKKDHFTILDYLCNNAIEY